MIERLPVLSLFDRTGHMVLPWAEAGHTCYCVDIQHERVHHIDVGKGTIYFIPGDIRTFEVPKLRFAAAFAFPPCTDLSGSGARWMKDKGPRSLIAALDLFVTGMEKCMATGAPGFAENPKSVASTHLRAPDHIFQPWQFTAYARDDNYTKTTCLWAFNGFRMPAINPHPQTEWAVRVVLEICGRSRPKDVAIQEITMLAPEYRSLIEDWYPDDRIHKAGPSAKRGDLRAATPLGFARAVFEANAPGVIPKTPDLFAALAS